MNNNPQNQPCRSLREIEAQVDVPAFGQRFTGTVLAPAHYL